MIEGTFTRVSKFLRYRSAAVLFGLIVSVVAASVACGNYLYFFRPNKARQQFGDSNFQSYILNLRDSEVGAEERYLLNDIKFKLSEFPADCVALGSCVIERIGAPDLSVMGCSSLLNLAVPSYKLGVMLVFLGRALDRGSQTFLLEVSPFHFVDQEPFLLGPVDHYDRDIINLEMQKSIERFGLSDLLPKSSSSGRSRLTSILSIKSLARAVSRPGGVDALLTEVKGFFVEGQAETVGRAPLVMPNGARVFPQSEAKKGGPGLEDDLKRFHDWNLPSAAFRLKDHRVRSFEIYRRLISVIRKANGKVVFMMVPSFASRLKEWGLDSTIFDFEKEFRTFAAGERVEVRGSWSSDVVGCLPNEFENTFTPLASCIRKSFSSMVGDPSSK